LSIRKEKKKSMAEQTTTILKPESLAKVLAVGSAPGVDSLHTRKSLHALYARQMHARELLLSHAQAQRC
jgi:hypothetical protein